jgi:hypothetical protein
MSNVIVNRQQRRAAQARARRAEQATIGSQKIDSDTRTKARKAVQIIKQGCPTLVATRSDLYRKCMDGVTVFEVLRRRGVPKSDEPFHYGSLLGQQTAHLFAKATLDNVLTVLIEETPDRKWSWNVVLDNGLVFGSREIEPCASREEAEEGALAGLGVIGSSAEPAPDYTPEVTPEEKLQIRVNSTAYVVRRIFDDPWASSDAQNDEARHAIRPLVH